MNNYRIKDCDLTKVMGEIVENYMKAYKTDLQYDLERIMKTSCETDDKRKWLVWTVYDSGTHMISLYNLLCKGYHEVAVWDAMNKHTSMKAFLIHVDDATHGSIYHVDTNELNEQIERKSRKANMVKYVFERGYLYKQYDEEMLAEQIRNEFGRFGDFVKYEYIHFDSGAIDFYFDLFLDVVKWATFPVHNNFKWWMEDLRNEREREYKEAM